MCSRILRLLLTVQLVCSDTEYYVRPTEPNGIACPGQPCLTLNEYTNDIDHYIKSNTMFTFLPGKHYMDRPLQIGHVQNITLKSADVGNGHTVLVPQYHCEPDRVCTSKYVFLSMCDFGPIRFDIDRIGHCTQCYAIRLSNVSHAHVDGVQVVLCALHSGLLTWYCKNIRITHVVITNIPNETFNSYEIGLGIYESTKILVDSLQANNIPWGIITYKSGRVTVKNTNIQNCSEAGVLIVDSDNVSVVNTLLQKNEYAIMSIDTRHILIYNCTILENSFSGITLIFTDNSDILHSLIDSNVFIGLHICRCTNASVSGIQPMYNELNIPNFYISPMMNVVVKHSSFSAIVFTLSTGTMKNVFSSNNLGEGLRIVESNISLKNVHVDYNLVGISIQYSIGTTIMNSFFIGNTGVGIKLLNASNTTIIHSQSVHNSGGDIHIMYGRDVKLVGTAASLIARESSIYWEDTIFSGISASSRMSSSTDPTSLPAIVELYNSSATVHNCSIISNFISFIKAFESHVTFSGELTFSHNTALVGTALIFARSSTLILIENCKVFFIDNQVSNFGGVIYIHTEELYVGGEAQYEKDFAYDNYYMYYEQFETVSMTECFIHVKGSRSDPRLVFINNTAGKGGDVLYGGLVVLGWDGDWNCLLSFKNISDMSQQSGLSAITSDPSRVCFCKDAKPDCLTVADPITHHVFPGQTIVVPAVIVGQDYGTVTGSVYVKFLNSSFHVEMAPGQSVTNVDQCKCNNIEYTVFSQHIGSETILVLTAGDTDISYTLDKSDNKEIENSWKFLSSEPNYHTLTSNISSFCINYTAKHRAPVITHYIYSNHIIRKKIL